MAINLTVNALRSYRDILVTKAARVLAAWTVQHAAIDITVRSVLQFLDESTGVREPNITAWRVPRGPQGRIRARRMDHAARRH
jgi:hypothetical protein